MVGAVAWVFLLEQVTRVPTAGRPWGHVAMVLTGVLAYAMSYSETARQHARPVAVALGVMLSLICIVSVLYYLPVHPEEDHHLPGTLILVMLATVAIFPLFLTILSRRANDGNTHFCIRNHLRQPFWRQRHCIHGPAAARRGQDREDWRANDVSRRDLKYAPSRCGTRTRVVRSSRRESTWKGISRP